MRSQELLAQVRCRGTAMEQGRRAIIFGEVRYHCLRWVPPFLGIPLGLYLQRKNGNRAAVALAVSTMTMLLQAVWRLTVDDLTCVRFTPDIRKLSKCFFQRQMQDKAKDNEKIRILDGFQQKVSRFLFLPNEEFWTNCDKVEVQTTLPDGSIETKSWLCKGKGIFAFTRAGDLDADKDVKAPYSFFRYDQSKAVVRVWSKTVDDGFRKALQMTQLWPSPENTGEQALIEDLSAAEKVAFEDYKQALTALLGAEGLKKGKIWKCIQKEATMNQHLAIQGKLQDVIQFLKEDTLATRHYFRCLVESDSSIVANMGFNLGRLPITPGTKETPIVLYIREGTKTHVCAQTLEVFANDTRVPERQSNQIACSFGCCELLERLGAGQFGEVYKVRDPDGRLLALKLAQTRMDETEAASMEKEKSIADLLQHRFFLKIYAWGVEWPKGRDFPGVPKKGFLMELGDESVHFFVLPNATTEGKMLDANWLGQCRELMAQIVFAITYMHGQNVIHCDLKPENILLKSVERNGQKRREVKLIDFGCAEQFRERLKGSAGTPAYKAPEINRGEGCGLKADVYSAGQTFDAMLRRRFCRPGHRDVLFPDLTPNKSPPPGSPDAVVKLLGKMRCDETNRYSASESMNDVFFRSFTWHNQFESINWETYN